MIASCDFNTGASGLVVFLLLPQCRKLMQKNNFLICFNGTETQNVISNLTNVQEQHLNLLHGLHDIHIFDYIVFIKN